MAGTVGSGWSVLYYDLKEDQLLNARLDERTFGSLCGAFPIAVMALPGTLSDAGTLASFTGTFLKTLKWSVAADRFHALDGVTHHLSAAA